MGDTYPVGPFAESLVVGDFNGDGKLDLVVADLGTNARQNQDGNITLLTGNGDGTFATPLVMGIEIAADIGPYSLIAADLNGDGKLDLAAIDSPGIVTFLNAAAAPPSLTVVSSASLTPGPIAPDSIATVFGKNLPATAPSVSIVDSTGKAFSTSILYASATQINFVIPAGLEAGPATVTVQSAGGSLTEQSGSALIAPVAPSLFMMNDTGLAGAYVTQVTSGGASTNETVFTVKNGIYTPVPIDVTSGQTSLMLLGTGIRNGAGFAVSSDSQIGGFVSAVPQPLTPGLDQVTVPLPSTLAGSGCINLSVESGALYSNSLPSNTVYICIK